MKYLAIDYGFKRTGLAVSDSTETIVSPLKVIKGKKKFIPEILKTIKKQQIQAVVVGLPINMDGTYGDQYKFTKEFAKKLEKSLSVPLYYHDERLSTFGAEKKLENLEMTYKKKKEILDAIAAAEILEEFLKNKKMENNDEKHEKTK